VKKNGHSSIDGHSSPPDLAPTTTVFGNVVARCQFWRRRDRRQCRKAARQGRRFCKRHGGNTVSIGPANPQFVHGRWSRLLPVSLRATGPSPLSLRDEIELVDARLEDHVHRIGEGAGTWAEVADAYGRLVGAMKDANQDALRTALTDLRDLGAGNVASADLWSDTLALVEKRATLVTAERKFLLDARNVLSRDQVAAIASALVSAVATHVKDRATVAAILADIRAVVDTEK
jgi:hypothetical protein